MTDDYSENKRKLRKIISVTSIMSVAIAGLIGLGLLFSILSFSDIIENILLSVLIVFIAGLCLLNALDAIVKKNKMGLITAGFVLISSVLILAMVWAGEYFGSFYDAYTKIVVIVAMASVFLDVIVGNYIIMGKKNLIIQIIDYLAFLYVEVAISFSILGSDALIKYYIPFIAAIIVFLVLFAILRVLARENRATDLAANKTELDQLKEENARLKKILEENGIEY